MNTDKHTISLGAFSATVVRKAIKNIHLSVYPPDGQVRISAPLSMELDTIRVFALSRLVWIKQQQAKLRGQQREPEREFLNRESHYFRGKRYLLQTIEQDAAPRIDLQHSTLVMYVRPHTDAARQRAILDDWYRQQLKLALPPLIAQWEQRMKVKVNTFGIKKMKTRWGTCNPQAGRIWLNLELAKKPPECLEYIVVHEMTHLLEPSHNARFVALMDEFMPKWQFHRDELNRLPVRHECWSY